MLRKNKVVRSEILLDRLVRCYTKSSSSGGSSTSISSSATTISSTANNSSIVNNRIFGPQNKSFSVATESHQLYNYTKLLQTIQSVTEKKQQFARIPLSSADSLFFQRRKLAEKEPYNHSENILYDKQIMIEEEQRTIAVEQYALMMKDLMKSGNATGTKSVRKMILNWYEPLTELILEERKLVARGDKTNDRGVS